jgi:undecaprenyl-phosphate 4-deoxy-4-formamido-L-arabinose transferase
MKISFVIPCYRSALSISAVVGEIVDLMGSRDADEYEIVLVSDASPDDVYRVILELCASNDRIIGVELAKNFGQHAALMCGYANVSGEIVVSLDDDGQAPVESTFDLVDAVLAGSDVVFGSYRIKQKSVPRRFGSFVNELMARWLLEKPWGLEITSFFAARRFVINEVIKYENSYPYLLGLLLRTTGKITNVPVTHRPRKVGGSNYTFRKLLRLWVNGFTAFSVKPLRLATLMGTLFAGFGFALGATVVLNKLLHPETPAGYSSMMATMLFVGGVQLIMLGMIGEYVGRTYISQNKSPQYVVRSISKRRHLETPSGIVKP